MKYKKIIFSIFIIICFTNVLHSQILEIGDYELYVRGMILIEYFGNNFENDISKLDNYLRSELRLYNLFMDFYDVEVITEELFNSIKFEYNSFLEIDVPGEIQRIYRIIGFKDNGHQKMYTINFGLIAWLLTIGNSEMSKLLELFDKNDLEILLKEREKLHTNLIFWTSTYLYSKLE